MKRDLPPYVHRLKGVAYFIRRGERATRLTTEPGTPDFWAEYARLLKGSRPAPATRTWRALIADYRTSDRFTRLAPRTQRDYDKVLALLERAWGDLDPGRVERRHVIELQRANADAVRFANYAVQVCGVVLEHAIDIGWRADNPAKGVRLLRSTRPPRGPWPDALVSAYRETATGAARLVGELCLGTGQRIGDVLRMRWDDIAGDAIRVKQGKTGRELWLPLTPSLRAVLAETPRRGLSIVTARDGRPLSYRTAHQAVMAVRQAIGAEAFTIHDWRHTTASELAALGLSDEVIMAVTGHRSVASVRRYAEAARQKARAKEAQRRRG